jgi:hypothetical protein
MNTIEKLQSERQRVVARLAEIDRILGQFEELQRIAESYLNFGISHTAPTGTVTDSVKMGEEPQTEPSASDPVLPRTQSPKTPMVEFERVVTELLSEAEKPLDRSALYKALLDREIVIGSPDESSDLNTLSARMSRMKEKVVNVSGYGYWPKDREFLPGGYVLQGAGDIQSSNDTNESNLV